MSAHFVELRMNQMNAFVHPVARQQEFQENYEQFQYAKILSSQQEFEIDPVCEMKVNPKSPPFQVIHKVKT